MYYTFHSAVSASVRSFINDAMDHVRENTCITFQERTDETDYVEFRQPSSGCSSPVGRDGGRQIIRLSQGCGFGSAVHEIVHSLGFWHEQSRPDRDSFVKINWDNIKDGKEGNFKRAHHNEVDSMGSVYDYGSIMHYGKRYFSKEGAGDTIEPFVEGAAIGQRTALSAHDIWQIKALYKCGGTCPTTHHKKVFYKGSAPWCSGKCPSHSEEIGRSKWGGGHFCLLGTKAKCKTCCRTVTSTAFKYFGTAPFCDGECPSGWTYVKKSKTGGGARCLVGWKHQCRKVTQAEQCSKPTKDYDPNCPPGGEKHSWFGAAPFCGFSTTCPSGWELVKTSMRGDGVRCLVGFKRLCKRSC